MIWVIPYWYSVPFMLLRLVEKSGKPVSPKLLGSAQFRLEIGVRRAAAKLSSLSHCWLKTVSEKNVGEKTCVYPRAAANSAVGRRLYAGRIARGN